MVDIAKEKYGVDESKLAGEFLKLKANVPIVLEFIKDSIKQTQREVRDDKTGVTSQKHFFEIGVDKIDGKKLSEEDPKTLSTTSKRLYNQLKPYLDEEESIYNKRFLIEKTGEGFETQYSVVPKDKEVPKEKAKEEK